MAEKDQKYFTTSHVASSKQDPEIDSCSESIR